jgi:hypothetical protein
MKIDKTIFNIDDVLLLSYGEIINQLEQMADIKLDIFYRLLELNEDDKEFEFLTHQCHYLQINIDIVLNVLNLLETNLIQTININGIETKYSLN